MISKNSLLIFSCSCIFSRGLLQSFGRLAERDGESSEEEDGESSEEEDIESSEEEDGESSEEEDIESLEKEDGESSEEDTMVDDEEDEDEGIGLSILSDVILIPCYFVFLYILVNIAITFNEIVHFFNMWIVSVRSLDAQSIKWS